MTTPDPTDPSSTVSGPMDAQRQCPADVPLPTRRMWRDVARTPEIRGAVRTEVQAARRAHHPRRGGDTRSLSELISDFGGQLPTGDAAPVTADRRADRGLLEPKTGRRGTAQVGHGWSPVPAPLIPYVASTAEVGGLFPFVVSPGLPPTGVPIGADLLSGGAFYADPIGWVRDYTPKITTNSNMMIMGAPGRGKSTLIKAIVTRFLRFGYRTLVTGDIKDEYSALCEAVGSEPIRFGMGLSARLNPLDLGPLGADWGQLSDEEQEARGAAIFARWLVLLKALVGVKLDRVYPSDEAAIAAALRSVTGFGKTEDTGSAAPPTRGINVATIPQVYQALADPSPELVRECRYGSRQDMIDDTRAVTDALGTMVNGALKGLFDDHTTIALDWNAPIQSLSLRALLPLGDEVIGVALACANSWSRAQTELRRPGQHTIVVRDEVWRQMRLGIGAVQSLDADLRLSRLDDNMEILAAHKPSDMLAVGDAGSQAVAIAKDLMSLCDTKVAFGMDATIADELAGLLGLGPVETEWVIRWARQREGRALWRVGDRSFKVQTYRLDHIEAELFDTDGSLRASADPEDRAADAAVEPVGAAALAAHLDAVDDADASHTAA